MKLHRFCSMQEYERYLKGEILENHTRFYRNGKGGSTSVGFCFFRGKIKDWARRLNGIVDFDVLLTVNIDPSAVNRSMGVYADWEKDDGITSPPRALFPEYCTTTYSREKFIFVSADFSYAYRYHSRKDLLTVYINSLSGTRCQ